MDPVDAMGAFVTVLGGDSLVSASRRVSRSAISRLSHFLKRASVGDQQVGWRNPTEEYIVLAGDTLMSEHDAEYFRQRRRSQGIHERDALSAQRFQQQATELQRLEQLPWPRNLFGEPATIRALIAEFAGADENTDDACSCGCCQQHKQNVTQTLRNPYGRGFDVIYFRSEACKIRWNQERRRAASGRIGTGATCEIGDGEASAASGPRLDDEVLY